MILTGRGIRRHTRRRTIRASFIVVALVSAGVIPSTAGATDYKFGAPINGFSTSNSCPWVAQSRDHSMSDVAMANEVLSRMTLSQRVSFAVLATYPPLENQNVGVPSLCVPPLSLSDGPMGLANRLIGVTSFPAEIGLAASFNPTLVRDVGEAIGQEARTKGISAVQSPELNLVRVPLDGRGFETYGEDPYLASVLGVADVEGIQSTGVMAEAKHFAAYTQETARARLNQVVSQRALAEIYDAPFRAVVEQAHVAGLMCAYGRLNGVDTCADPAIYSTLRSWHFNGFVRSDQRAAHSIAAAFAAGISLVKPASLQRLQRSVDFGELPISDLNRAVRSVLVEMFRFHDIGRRVRHSIFTTATTPGHVAVALRAAEDSVVLLKNNGVLPLANGDTSVALIGTDADRGLVDAGGGSSQVITSYVSTPWSALHRALGKRCHVLYAPGGPLSENLDAFQGLHVVSGRPLKLVTPLHQSGEPGKADLRIDNAANVTPYVVTATAPRRGHFWMKWKMKARAESTGTFDLTIQQYGDTWLYLNGRTILGSPGLHARDDTSAAVHLTRGHVYTFAARWFAVTHHVPPKFSIIDVTSQIDAAVALARRSKVAIVFAGDESTEGADRPNLDLPGDENALIEAVAAANSHTVVVLNTGGAIVMPWLKHVAAVLEAWYPGQEDGAAIAAVLSGSVDPSGRLPITFPASETETPESTARMFPGVDGTVHFGSDLDIGYRWYQSNHVAPLFSFGYGLDYTNFDLSDPLVATTSSGVVVRVSVTNAGARSGADVVQVYVHDPLVTGEPPEQLRAFARAVLSPGQTRRLMLVVPWSALQVFRHGAFTMVAGQYGIGVGQSSADLVYQSNVTYAPNRRTSA
jgi:beta-glucosidase